MNIEENKIISSTHTAFDRVLSRIRGVQDGYIVIIQSRHVALKGDEDMKRLMDDLDKNLEPTGMMGEEYFLSILFLDLISEIEMFLSNIVKAVITEHPRKLGSTNFKLSEIIDAESIDDLITRAADEFIIN